MEIIYEDNNFICVNKKAGVPSQPDLTGDISTFDTVKSYLGSEVYIINRIDRPVSGVVIFTKNKKSVNEFSKLIASNKNDKIYYAIVENEPPQKADILIDALIKKNNKAYISKDKQRGKVSTLVYKYIGSGERYHYLEIVLKSGRFHQIRAQLSNIGCTIKGDVKYGARRSNKDKSICLHAYLYKLGSLQLIAPFPNTPLWNDLQNNIFNNTSYKSKYPT